MKTNKILALALSLGFITSNIAPAFAQEEQDLTNENVKIEGKEEEILPLEETSNIESKSVDQQYDDFEFTDFVEDGYVVSEGAEDSDFDLKAEDLGEDFNKELRDFTISVKYLPNFNNLKKPKMKSSYTEDQWEIEEYQRLFSKAYDKRDEENQIDLSELVKNAKDNGIKFNSGQELLNFVSEVKKNSTIYQNDTIMYESRGGNLTYNNDFSYVKYKFSTYEEDSQARSDEYVKASITEEEKSKVEEKVGQIVGELDQDLSDLEKAEKLADIVAKGSTYAKEIEENEGKKNNAYGALFEKESQCEGFATAYTLLLRKAGIPAYTVTGLMNKNDRKSGHAWNLVYINDTWSIVDMTGVVSAYNTEIKVNGEIIKDSDDPEIRAKMDSRIQANKEKYFLKTYDDEEFTNYKVNPRFESNIIGLDKEEARKVEEFIATILGETNGMNELTLEDLKKVDKWIENEEKTKKVIPATPIEDIAKTSKPWTEIEDIAKTSKPWTEIEDIAKISKPWTEIEDIAKISKPWTEIEDIAKISKPWTEIEDIAKISKPWTEIEDIAKISKPWTEIEDIAKISKPWTEIEDIAKISKPWSEIEDIAKISKPWAEIEDIAKISKPWSEIEDIAKISKPWTEIEDIAKISKPWTEIEDIAKISKPWTEIEDIAKISKPWTEIEDIAKISKPWTEIEDIAKISKPWSEIEDIAKPIEKEKESIEWTEIEDIAKTSKPWTEIEDIAKTSKPWTEIEDIAKISKPWTEIEDIAKISKPWREIEDIAKISKPWTEIEDIAKISKPWREIEDIAKISKPWTEIEDIAKISKPWTEIEDIAKISKPWTEIEDIAKPIEKEKESLEWSEIEDIAKIDEYYKDIFLNSLLTLPNLTEAEKIDFRDLIKDARTKKQVYEVYNNSIKLNNSRNKLEGTSDPQIVIPDLALDQIENNTGEEIKEGEYIYVDKGYNVRKEGYYKKDDLLNQYNQLKIAVNNNEIVAKSSEFLLEHTPKTVRNIKDKLVSQIEKAKRLKEKAYKLLLEFERILGL